MATPLNLPATRSAFPRTAVRNTEHVSGKGPPPCYRGRMTQPGGGDSTEFVDEADVDTVELELRPEDLARLSKARGSADGAAPADISSAVEQAEVPNAAERGTPPTGVPDAADATPAEASRTAPTSAPDIAAPAAVAIPAADATQAHVASPVAVTTQAARAPSATVAARAAPATRAPAGANRAEPVARGTLVVRDTPTSGPSEEAVRLVGDEEPAIRLRASEEPRRDTRWRWVAALAGAVTLVAASGWLASGSSSETQEAPVVPAPAPIPQQQATEPVSMPVAPPPREEAPPAATPGEVVKYRNPFDASEVFEFPAGTSRTEARDAVAEFLLQRARERRSVGRVPDRQSAEAIERNRRT
jgi:hypothetical protein